MFVESGARLCRVGPRVDEDFPYSPEERSRIAADRYISEGIFLKESPGNRDHGDTRPRRSNPARKSVSIFCWNGLAKEDQVEIAPSEMIDSLFD